MRKKQQVHPLALERGTTPIDGWGHWRRLWDNTSVAEIRHGLLHFGFKVPCAWEELSERVTFYLDVADTGNSFLGSEEREYRIRSSFGDETNVGIRRAVSRKALEVLAFEFFRDQEFDRRERGRPAYADLIWQDALLDKLVWFARHSDGDTSRSRFLNIERQGPADELVRNFYASVACQILGIRRPEKLFGRRWEDRRGHEDESFREKAEKYGPDFVEILFRLGHLSLLLGENVSPLAENSLNRLEDLALLAVRYDPRGTESHPAVESVAEAVYVGNPAAETLTLLRIKYSERDRLNEILRLEEEERDARRRREALSKVKIS